MKRSTLLAFTFALALLGTGRASAQPPAAGADTTVRPPSGSLSNPAISVIGWFQAAAGNDPALPAEAFALPEAELAFQAAVDPHSRAEFFLAAGPEGLDLEEGTLTWLALPGGGQAKVGRFRADLGKFNRTHAAETPFADRPLAAATWLGEEGLAFAGVSASFLIPNPANLYWDVIAQVGAAPDSLASPVFGPERRGDVLALARTSVFLPLGEAADLNLGLSVAGARAHPALRADGADTRLGAMDLTLRWKNPRRAIYRSLLVQVELLAGRGSADGTPTRGGGYGYAVFQFARRWAAGARLDRADGPGGGERVHGALGLLRFRPSEFSTLSLQYRRVHDRTDDRDHDSAFFQWTFNIGPHGSHPY